MENKDVIEIIDGQYKVVVKKSDIAKAEKMTAQGKIKKVTLNLNDVNSLWKECYFMYKGTKETADNSFKHVYYIWPTVFGYSSRINGYIWYFNKKVEEQYLIKEMEDIFNKTGVYNGSGTIPFATNILKQWLKKQFFRLKNLF